MKRQILLTVAYVLLFGSALLAQSAPHGLRPGTSVRTDVERAFGPPVRDVSKTLAEYTSGSQGQRIFAQYRSDSDVLERLEVVYAPPRERGQVLQDLALPEQPSASNTSDIGRHEEYFSRQLVVLTYSDSGVTGGVSRVGYYSRELFQSTMPGGNPASQPGGSASMTVASGRQTVPSVSGPSLTSTPDSGRQIAPASSSGAPNGSVVGTWTGLWSNSDGATGKSTLILKEENGTIRGAEEDIVLSGGSVPVRVQYGIVNGRRTGNVLTWEYWNRIYRCRSDTVHLEISADGKLLNGTRNATAGCGNQVLTDNYLNYHR